jgi:hypothetical protein
MVLKNFLCRARPSDYHEGAFRPTRGGHRNHNGGLMLVKAMVVAAIVPIIALGGLLYQYQTARQFRIAHEELTATRAAQLLLEDWKGSGATNPENYDANSLGLGFAGQDTDYVITVDRVKMFMHLSYRDVEVDSDAGITLRELQVRAEWGPEAPGGSAPSLVLTTYARKGQD